MNETENKNTFGYKNMLSNEEYLDFFILKIKLGLSWNNLGILYKTKPDKIRKKFYKLQNIFDKTYKILSGNIDKVKNLSFTLSIQVIYKINME